MKIGSPTNMFEDKQDFERIVIAQGTIFGHGKSLLMIMTKIRVIITPFLKIINMMEMMLISLRR